jgi:hypothetical protein
MLVGMEQDPNGVVLGIVLGWLLALLSPAIVKKISEAREKSNLENVIFSDLKDLKKRLAPLSFLVCPKYGKLDKKTFDWLKVNSDVDFLSGLEELAKKGMTEDEVVSQLNANGLTKKTLSHFKKAHLFATDSLMMNLGLIDKSLRSDILEVRFRVEAFNEDVDSFRELLKMTFLPALSSENHTIISKELENKSLMLAQKSIYIVDKINEILNARKVAL